MKQCEGCEELCDTLYENRPLCGTCLPKVKAWYENSLATLKKNFTGTIIGKSKFIGTFSKAVRNSAKIRSLSKSYDVPGTTDECEHDE